MEELRSSGGLARSPRTLSEIMCAYEKSIIAQSLRLNGYSRKQTASSLGVSRYYLWRRMRSLGIAERRSGGECCR